jgi:hypothetical protein
LRTDIPLAARPGGFESLLRRQRDIAILLRICYLSP